jgi:hypothetical protein
MRYLICPEAPAQISATEPAFWGTVALVDATWFVGTSDEWVPALQSTPAAAGQHRAVRGAAEEPLCGGVSMAMRDHL